MARYRLLAPFPFRYRLLAPFPFWPRFHSPIKAAFDDPPDQAALLDRLTALAESFAADRDGELAEALRATAEAVEAARAAGARCRLVAVPPYPCGQALDLMGSPRRYA